MNETIFYFFYNFAHQAVWLDKLIIFTAVYFPFVVMLLAFLYLLFYKKSLRYLIFVFFTAGLAGIVSKLFKILIHTPRPAFVLPDVQALFEKTSYAFPSDHASFFMALALAIFFINKKAGLPAQAGHVFMLLALLIGLARIIAGVHFPIDILGGFALGALVAYLAAELARQDLASKQ